MKEDDEQEAEERPTKRRFNWEIYYVEKVGSRYVFRIGHMFWILLAIMLIGLLVAFLFDPLR